MSNECKWCEVNFQNTQDLRQHWKLDLDAHQYYCQQCKRTFRSFTGLKQHLKTALKHRTQSPTERAVDMEAYCQPCRRQFANSGRLVVHMATAHETDVLCEICGACFPYRSSLQDHMASPVHNERNIPCPHCSMLLKTTSGVAHHLEYKCLKKITQTVIEWDTEHQITDQVYTNRIREVASDDEDDDILVIKRNPVIQEILKVLAGADTWDSVAQAYVCPVADCDRKFRKLGSLNQHLRSQIHRTDPSTFRCPKCESRFSVVSALIQHLESGSCGLAEFNVVKEIYGGLQDMFRRLLTF